ncbi:MAG: spore photoproduct lyase [Firmicutes bacterium]|nr:spore photoproduct lyase [Bacillota bacterium]
MRLFIPDFAFFEPEALQYPIGREIEQRLRALNVPIRETTSHNRVTGIPGDTPNEKYKNAKNTLVVGLRKTLTFDTSKPSADYAIPISTGCMGHCHYCYLQTTLGAKPYIRVYVNMDQILDAARGYIRERAPEVTTFEAACTSDPVGIEHLTGNLARVVEFAGQEPLARLRFVTKYDGVEPFLHLEHGGHTYFRFSVNADYVIRHFEPGTAPFAERLAAASKVYQAGYKLGLIVAPLIRFEGWEDGYAQLFERLAQHLPRDSDLRFELIQHRFTATAKRIILERYPKTKLEMDETKRKYKWGRYGRGKWVYQDDEATTLRRHLEGLIHTHFPLATIEYFT